MALEIEHKYLVINDSYKTMAFEHVKISQGYLNRLPERTVRIRTINDKGYLTVKGKNKGDIRHEYEYSIPFEDAQEMLQLCEPGIIEKMRYKVNFDNLIWEIDEYHGRLKGIIIAEVEIPCSNHVYLLPDFIGKNVTGDPRYYNSNM